MSDFIHGHGYTAGKNKVTRVWNSRNNEQLLHTFRGWISTREILESEWNHECKPRLRDKKYSYRQIQLEIRELLDD